MLSEMLSLNGRARPDALRSPEEPKVDLDARGSAGLSCPKPDAPLRSVGRWITAILHATVLCGIAGLLLWYILHVPALLRDRTFATIVAPSLVQVRSPVDGVFIATSDLPAGTHVEKGQLLGRVDAPRLESEIRAMERQLGALRRRRLRLGAPSSSPVQLAAESHAERLIDDCVERIIALESELEWLRGVEKRLRIASPTTGRIQYGVTGSTAVRTNDPLVHVWPEGGDLLVEIEAPLDVVHEIIRDGIVEARFSTAEGIVRVQSVPIVTSIRVTAGQEESGIERGEIFGFVQCRPLSIPRAVAFPGPIGTLSR